MSPLENYYFSVIIPVYNELENLDALYRDLKIGLSVYEGKYEIIFVDDGSNDGSYNKLKTFAKENPFVKLLRFRRNFGQTAAMSAGIDHSSGNILVFMDADLQNDPSDIPLLLKKLEEGYDVVCGWRKKRKDKLFYRKIPSQIANYIIRKVSHVNIHDIGCSLKVFRREIIKDINMYGEMHRFLPVLAARIGADITEMPVKHHPRIHGKSKYGLNRTFKVLFDLITVQFMRSFSTKPIYLYGGFAIFSLILSIFSGLAVLFMKLYWGTDITGNPFFLLTILCILITVIFLLMGIQSEVLIRIYHQQDKIKQYYIKESQNIADIP